MEKYLYEYADAVPDVQLVETVSHIMDMQIACFLHYAI